MRLKLIGVAAAAFALALAVAVPVFADDYANYNSSTNGSTNSGLTNSGLTNNGAGEKDHGKKPEVKKTPAVLDVACLQSAIDKRDTALLTAVVARGTALSTALAARRDALKAAVALTDVKARKAAQKDAWKAWSKSSKKALADMRSSRLGAWKTFYADRKACGRPAVQADTSSSGVDAGL